LSRARVELQHLPARALRRVAASNQDLAQDSCYRRVTQRLWQLADDGGRAARAPGEDRVEGRPTCVSADQVGGAVDGRGAEVRVWLRQRPGRLRLAGGRIQPDDA